MSTAWFVGCRRAVCVAALLCWSAAAPAQAVRTFPAIALRGMLVFGEMPELRLNGRPARLAPGARLHDADNRLTQPATVYGGEFIVDYTLDTGGALDNVWLLRPEEAAVLPWPRTPEQQAAWRFDPIAQRWSRP